MTGRAINRHALYPKDPRRTTPQSTSKPKPPHNQEFHDQHFIRESSEELADVISPVNSSGYLLSSSSFLLNDTSFFNIPEPIPPPVKCEFSKSHCIRGDELSALRPSSSTRPQDHVVILRVSLHCKGCEGKVRKHMSKMEVTYFSIDLATKKVTVIGDVTPLGVLNSISEVKNAQFWPSPTQRN